MSWKVTLEDVIADRRRAMGDPPSLDELIDLRENRLSADERERILERAAVDPQVARDLLDVVDYPALPPGEDEPDGEGRALRWRRFQERLQAEVPGTADQGEDVAVRRAAALPFPWWGLAASFVVGTLAGSISWQILRPPPPEPAPPGGNVEIVGLSFEQGPGTRGGRVELPESAQWALFTFGSARLPSASDYGILIHDAAGTEVWRHDGLVTGSGGLLTVLVPAKVFAPGGYRAEIYPNGDFEREPAGTAVWTVEAIPP